MSVELKIVIIGGVAAGPKAAARARRLAPNADITIIEKDTYISYAGCGMPFYMSGQIREFKDLFTTSYGVVRDTEYFQNEKGVKVLTGTEAVAIDRVNKKVEVVNLGTGNHSHIEYDKLVIATGADPFVPPLEGLDLKGVYRLSTPKDVLAIKEALAEGVSDVAIVGAGMIGMETAEALLKLKVFPTIVELKDQILAGALDPDMAAVLAMRLEEKGFEFNLGRNVQKIEGQNGKVSALITDQGRLETEMVIVAVGVRPNVKLAKEANLEIGQTHAIAVNEYLQTSDPDIYALGDCIENTNLVTGQKVYLALASYANRQGRVVGDNITGGKSKFKGVLGSSVFRAGGINVARTGLTEEQAKRAGCEVITSVNSTFDSTHYYPHNGKMLLKIVADAKTRRVLGAQGFGVGEVAKRIDVLAAAITFGATIDDVFDIDTAYSPAFNTPIDALHHSVNIVRNKIDGIAEGISAIDVKKRFDSGDDFVFLDVRSREHFEAKHINDPRVMVIPLGGIRRRIAEIPREKEIITSCVLGGRAYEATGILKGAGFENVKFMEGSLDAWPYELD